MGLGVRNVCKRQDHLGFKTPGQGDKVLHDFGLRKVSPATQLLIQQVGFVNLRYFSQHRSRAKHI